MTTLADRLRAAIDAHEADAVQFHRLDCELAMTAGYHGPCTCGEIKRRRRRCAADRKLLDMWQHDHLGDLEARIHNWTSCSDSCVPTIGEYVLATLAEAYGVEA